MPQNCRFLNHNGPLWITSKARYRNLIPATFHILAITLISMSLVKIPWIVVTNTGGVCMSYLAVGDFFSYGYGHEYTHHLEYDCITLTIVNLMRTIILLCFMAIIFSLAGLFLDILSPKSGIYRFICKHALASTCTVLWIMAVVSICYYVTVLLEESLRSSHPEFDAAVSYGYGFYLIASTGGIVLLGTFCTLILMPSSDSNRIDERCLLSRYGDGMESFDGPTPPPPYSIPPPPYTP